MLRKLLLPLALVACIASALTILELQTYAMGDPCTYPDTWRTHEIGECSGGKTWLKADDFNLTWRYHWTTCDDLRPAWEEQVPKNSCYKTGLVYRWPSSSISPDLPDPFIPDKDPLPVNITLSFYTDQYCKTKPEVIVHPLRFNECYYFRDFGRPFRFRYVVNHTMLVAHKYDWFDRNCTAKVHSGWYYSFRNTCRGFGLPVW